MKVLFLDIDGVLNNEAFLLNEIKTKHSIYLIDDVCLNNLQKIKNAIKDLKICIISSWRHITTGMKVLKEKNIYNPEKDFVLDVDKDRRIYEIHDWLKRHNDVEKFVILDDDDDGYSIYNSKNYVRTSFEDSGLTSDLADVVISKLK